MDSLYFLSSTRDMTDRTSAIEQMLQQHGVCILGSGDYFVSGIHMPENSTLMGVGKATRLILADGISGGTVFMNSFCTVKDLCVTGATTDLGTPAQLGDRHGICYVGTATPECWVGQPQNVIISGCFITNFTGGGILLERTGYSDTCAAVVSDCHILDCGAGIYIPFFSEFHKITNVLCHHCLYGCINNGGNNMFVNCGFTSNVTGFLMDNSHGRSKNNSHGSVVGCTFNHSGKNEGIGIQILGAKNGFIFTGCQMFYSKIVVEDSDGIVFDTFNFGRNMDISVKGGRLVMFSNCGFAQHPASIKRLEDAKLRFANCYTWDGEEVK